MPPFLLSPESFTQFLQRFESGELPRAEWNYAAHLAMSAATIHAGGDKDTVRARILIYAKAQGIVSTPDSGYHEAITGFWVERIAGLTAARGRFRLRPSRTPLRRLLQLRPYRQPQGAGLRPLVWEPVQLYAANYLGTRKGVPTGGAS